MRHFARNRDFTKVELLPFGDVNNQKDSIAFAGDFCIGAVDPEIDIAARQIEISQYLLIKFDPVINQRIFVDKRPQKASLFGFENPAQPAIRVNLIAQKRDPLDFCGVAFGDFKRQIVTVVAAADDPGRTREARRP